MVRIPEHRLIFRRARPGCLPLRRRARGRLRRSGPSRGCRTRRSIAPTPRGAPRTRKSLNPRSHRDGRSLRDGRRGCLRRLLQSMAKGLRRIESHWPRDGQQRASNARWTSEGWGTAQCCQARRLRTDMIDRIETFNKRHSHCTFNITRGCAMQ